MDELLRIRGTDFVVTDCITCGCVFVVARSCYEQQRRMGGFHHCPNGHRQGWSQGGTEFDQLRRERDRLQQKMAQKDDELAAERTAKRKAENQVVRMRKRAQAGVCLECNRSFPNLKLHMECKHNPSRTPLSRGAVKSALAQS